MDVLMIHLKQLSQYSPGDTDGNHEKHTTGYTILLSRPPFIPLNVLGKGNCYVFSSFVVSKSGYQFHNSVILHTSFICVSCLPLLGTLLYLFTACLFINICPEISCNVFALFDTEDKSTYLQRTHGSSRLDIRI